MKDTVILQDKNFISARRAAEIFGYTSDYVGQLCRAGKLECKMIGRSWFVDQESLAKHQKSFSPELVSKNTPELVSEKVVEKVVERVVERVVEIPKVIEVAPEPLRPLSFVPQMFALPDHLSSSFLTISSPAIPVTSSFDFAKLVFVSIFAILSLGISFQSLSKNTNVIAVVSSNPFTASILSSSAHVVQKVFSLFSTIPQLAINTFKEDQAKDTSSPVSVQNDSQKDFNGIAIVPSSNSPAKDEVIKGKIKSSFSDEVSVKPDESGTAGIITPVFRKAKGDDFVYVLVPVKNQ